ncbi:polysaccharide biosynthesis tyrosine autokinase [Dermatobacter hominis]|uniref:polysaccharide biosynthesis tyrosine autokinase n=1 Tax=Dermatobacter hominis TaxID=2884263 RepID=UPI001D0F8AB4|nr:hypothetical protein [Dermatobacter hominis]UDY33922.1 hypothetical protein LH044_11250 [Dermatobacter hominis]
MTKIRAVLRRRWPIVAVALVLGAIAGALSTVVAPSQTQTTFKATEVIVANRTTTGAQGNVEQDALKVTRGEIAAAAAERLGEEGDVKELAADIEAVPDVESASIEVSSEDTDSQLAARRVDAFVQAFLDVTNADLLQDQQARGAELQKTVDQAQAALDAFDEANPTAIAPTQSPQSQALAAQRDQLAVQLADASSQLTDFRVNAQATLPYSSLGTEAPTPVDNQLVPVPSSPIFRMGLLGLVGAVLGLGLILVIERLSPRIDTRDELVDAVDVPIVAEVGNVPRKRIPRAEGARLRLTGSWAEPNRRIRSAIQFLQANPRFSGTADGDGPVRPPRVFLFTSASPGEGKSTTVALTALALAESGTDTLVVGGDFRRPSIDALLGSATQPGIRDLARLDVHRPTHPEVVHGTPTAHLWVAPSGPATKEVVGLAEAARELIADAAQQGGTVLVDSCPVEAANDAIDLLPVVDEVILIVRSGRTARSTLENTIELLRQHNAHLMGVVLIGTPGLGKVQDYFEGYYGPPDDLRGLPAAPAPLAAAPAVAAPAPAATPHAAPVPPPHAPAAPPPAAPPAPGPPAAPVAPPNGVPVNGNGSGLPTPNGTNGVAPGVPTGVPTPPPFGTGPGPGPQG